MSMQQPVRYYITKSGDESTVRSVKVAQPAAVAEDGDLVAAKPELSVSTKPRGEEQQNQGVRGLVQDAIRRRLPAS